MSEATTTAAWDDLLVVWFGSSDLRAEVDQAHRMAWFRPDPAFDQMLRDRFGALVDDAREGRLEEWRASVGGTVALLLLLDQLPRNLFRGDDARAFASDAKAVAVASEAVEKGFDRQVGTSQRGFFYLPFEHAEDMAAQDRSVALFTSLGEDASAEGNAMAASFREYAEKHRAVIAKFGRFPHRNAALGRASTEAEAEFLKAGRGF